MNTLLIYMLKAALYTSAFYMVYSLLLSKDTLYSRNRSFILLSVIASLVLPLITIETEKPFNLPVFGKTLSEILITASSGSAGSLHPGDSWAEVSKLITLIYLTGLLLAGIKLLTDIIELVVLIIRKKSPDSHIIRFSGFNTAGFSALGYVFINSRLNQKETYEILKHEQYHLDNYHFVDIMFIEITKVFLWFNPFIHFFDRSLRAVHEFQADEGCLNKGIPVPDYQLLIMSQIFRSGVFKITNSFSNPTLIKKRMIMMTKERSGTLANLKLLMVLPVIAIVMFAFSSCKDKSETEDGTETEISSQVIPVDGSTKVIAGSPSVTDEMAPPPPPPPPADGSGNHPESYATVDEMPVFPGGDQGLMKFIYENARYPENAKVNGIMGKVVVQFIVMPDKTIEKVSIFKGVDPELDKEALRVVTALPPFEKPGYLGGIAVPVTYMIPINFTLK